MMKIVKNTRSKNYYIRGIVNGQSIYESTKTHVLEEAQAYLEQRRGEFYRKAVLRDNPLPAITTEMMNELVYLASRARNRSQKNDREDRITVQFVKDMYLEQYGKCAVSGIDFRLTELRPGDARSRAFAPSLDRIDNTLGYVDGNVRLVCRIANFAMNIWGDAALLELARGMTDVWARSCDRIMDSHFGKWSRNGKTDDISKN